MFAVVCANTTTNFFNERYPSYQTAMRAAMIVAQNFNAESAVTAVVYTDTGEVIEIF